MDKSLVNELLVRGYSFWFLLWEQIQGLQQFLFYYFNINLIM